MFITIEGIEGSGKTSHIPYVKRHLKQAGFDCLATREPGGTPIGVQIRSVLLNPDNWDLSPTAEMLLYVADRAQHLEKVVNKSIADGKVVICDRYFDSTLVYQGYARGIDTVTIRKLHQLVCNWVMPDLTILLDLHPKIGLDRAWRRIHSDDVYCCESRLEAETLAFHKRVRDGYLDLAKNEPWRFAVIDAALDVVSVRLKIESVLDDFIKSYEPK